MRALKPRFVVPGRLNNPYGIRTALGWGVIGTKGHGDRADDAGEAAAQRWELKKALAEMDQDQVRVEMLKENCDWFEVKLNVSSASHMGGIWECQIGTVRSVLSALLEKNRRQMNEEALRTFMSEAEAVVNSRPLTAEASHHQVQQKH